MLNKTKTTILIGEMLKVNPELTIKEIIQKLKDEHRISMSIEAVRSVKKRWNREQETIRLPPSRIDLPTVSNDQDLTLDKLKYFWESVKSVGGIRTAKEILEIFGENLP